jgi:hypothetical protein
MMQQESERGCHSTWKQSPFLAFSVHQTINDFIALLDSHSVTMKHRPWLLTTLLVLVSVAAVALVIWKASIALPFYHTMMQDHREAKALIEDFRQQQQHQQQVPWLIIVPMAGGSYAKTWLPQVLHHVFPRHKAIWNADRQLWDFQNVPHGTLYLGVVSSFPRARDAPEHATLKAMRQAYAAYRDAVTAAKVPRAAFAGHGLPQELPVVAWNGEPYPVLAAPSAGLRLISNTHDLAQQRTDFPQAKAVLYLPQAMQHSGTLPRSLRYLDSDDVAARPVLLGFMQTNCKVFRDRMFLDLKGALKAAVPDARIEARGACGHVPSLPGFPCPWRRSPGTWDAGRTSVEEHLPGWVATMADCRFILAVENSLNLPGYVSEKLINAFLAGAIPLYWGDSVTAARWFNREAFVDLGAFETREAAIAAVAALAQDPDRMRAMRAAPVFRENAGFPIQEALQKNMAAAPWRDVVAVLQNLYT